MDDNTYDGNSLSPPKKKPTLIRGHEMVSKKDTTCKGCWEKGHWYHACSITNIDGGMKGYPLCETPEHPIWECPRKGEVKQKDLWYLFVKARHGLPQFASCWNPWEIDPERWIEHPEFRPQSFQFTKDYELKNGKQLFDVRTEDDLWKKDDWMEQVGDQRAPGCHRLHFIPGRKGAFTDAELANEVIEEAAKAKAAARKAADEEKAARQAATAAKNATASAFNGTKTIPEEGTKKPSLLQQETQQCVADSQIGASRTSGAKGRRRRSYQRNRTQSLQERRYSSIYRERSPVGYDEFPTRYSRYSTLPGSGIRSRSPMGYPIPSSRYDRPPARYQPGCRPPSSSHDEYDDEELARAYAIVGRHQALEHGRGLQRQHPYESSRRPRSSYSGRRYPHEPSRHPPPLYNRRHEVFDDCTRTIDIERMRDLERQNPIRSSSQHEYQDRGRGRGSWYNRGDQDGRESRESPRNGNDRVLGGADNGGDPRFGTRGTCRPKEEGDDIEIHY